MRMGPRIFWVLLVAFTVGVFLRTFIPFGWVTIFFISIAALVAAFAYLRERSVPLLLTCLALGAFALGAARMHSSIVEREPMLDVFVGEKVVVEGIVQDEPDLRENNVRIPLRVTGVASTSIKSDIAILVIAPLHTEVAYGDHLRVEGELAVPETFETGEGRTFDYPGFLAKDAILYQISFAKVTRIEGDGGNALKSWAIWLKQGYLKGLTHSLSEPHAGLAGGITVGDKRGLGEELSETFRVVGLTHIVVLSGYNIMVVVEALLRWLSGAPQAVRLGIAGFVALFFAAITGFASASTRAAAMAMIAITGKATGRAYLASRALAFVAALMILWNPYVLVYDPGFQLSILATAGLIFLTPLVEPYLAWLTPRFGLREIAAASIGTQIAVLPLLLFQNGMLSLFALPANLFALIVIPWAMLLSAIAAIFGLFTGVLAPFFGFPAYALLSYVISVAKVFAALPFSAVQLPPFGAGLLVAAYVVLMLVVFKKKTAGS